MRQQFLCAVLALSALSFAAADVQASSMNKTYNVTGNVFLGPLSDTVSGTITTTGTPGGAGTFNTNLTSGNHGGVGFNGDFTEQNFAASNLAISRGTATFEGVISGSFLAIQIGSRLIVIGSGSGGGIFGLISLSGNEAPAP